MAYNPTTIANYFITHYGENGRLTPMKLIQISYISYGWYMALTNKKERLMDETVVAKDFGPYFLSLFESLRGLGGTIIKKRLPNAINDDKISDRDKKFLDRIWKVYGRYDGIFLGAMIRKEDTLWKGVSSGGSWSFILDDDIFVYYRKRMKAPEGT